MVKLHATIFRHEQVGAVILGHIFRLWVDDIVADNILPIIFDIVRWVLAGRSWMDGFLGLLWNVLPDILEKISATRI